MTEKKTAAKAKPAAAKKKEIKRTALESVYDRSKAYPIGEAIEIVKKASKTKFDSSIEVHMRLGIDPRKGDQQIRTAVSLPHGTGKTIRVAAFVSADKEAAVKAAGADLAGGDELIAQIKASEKTDFDVAVAEPLMMRNLAQIAKILGTRGLMPSPKNDTVSPDPAKAVAELKKGKVSFKNDETGNLHILIGKISFDSAKLEENFTTILETVKKIKPSSSKGVYLRNVTICSTMGPGVKVQISR